MNYLPIAPTTMSQLIAKLQTEFEGTPPVMISNNKQEGEVFPYYYGIDTHTALIHRGMYTIKGRLDILIPEEIKEKFSY